MLSALPDDIWVQLLARIDLRARAALRLSCTALCDAVDAAHTGSVALAAPPLRAAAAAVAPQLRAAAAAAPQRAGIPAAYVAACFPRATALDLRYWPLKAGSGALKEELRLLTTAVGAAPPPRRCTWRAGRQAAGPHAPSLPVRSPAAGPPAHHRRAPSGQQKPPPLRRPQPPPPSRQLPLLLRVTAVRGAPPDAAMVRALLSALPKLEALELDWGPRGGSKPPFDRNLAEALSPVGRLRRLGLLRLIHPKLLSTKMAANLALLTGITSLSLSRAADWRIADRGTRQLPLECFSQLTRLQELRLPFTSEPISLGLHPSITRLDLMGSCPPMVVYIDTDRFAEISRAFPAPRRLDMPDVKVSDMYGMNPLGMWLLNPQGPPPPLQLAALTRFTVRACLLDDLAQMPALRSLSLIAGDGARLFRRLADGGGGLPQIADLTLGCLASWAGDAAAAEWDGHHPQPPLPAPTPADHAAASPPAPAAAYLRRLRMAAGSLQDAVFEAFVSSGAAAHLEEAWIDCAFSQCNPCSLLEPMLAAAPALRRLRLDLVPARNVIVRESCIRPGKARYWDDAAVAALAARLGAVRGPALGRIELFLPHNSICDAAGGGGGGAAAPPVSMAGGVTWAACVQLGDAYPWLEVGEYLTAAGF